eukprot:2538955-Rhodomonas_salina.2
MQRHGPQRSVCSLSGPKSSGRWRSLLRADRLQIWYEKDRNVPGREIASVQREREILRAEVYRKSESSSKKGTE